MSPGFLFATAIENSIATINGSRLRMDELDKCGHYQHWETDFALVRKLGINFLRHGPPLQRTFLGTSHYDWKFCDLAFARLQQLSIVPIVDLCHFGVPDWIGNFQNPDFPDLFAQYAAAFANQYPWVPLSAVGIQGASFSRLRLTSNRRWQRSQQEYLEWMGD